MQAEEKITINQTPVPINSSIRHDWRLHEVEGLFAMPFNDLLFHAHSLYREHFDPNEVQVSQLLSIKTGACSEDCAYCPQSARYDTGLSFRSFSSSGWRLSITSSMMPNTRASSADIK